MIDEQDAITGGVVLPAASTEEERRDADKVRIRIKVLLQDIKKEEHQLESNYSRLGKELLTVRSQKYWILWGYRSWGSYIAAVSAEYNRGRSQLYKFVGIVDQLLPQLGEETLAEIGVNKAEHLQRFVRESGGRLVPDRLLEAAKDPEKTAEDLHEAVLAELHAPDDEKGKWRHLPGFYHTDDEWQELLKAFAYARRVDPPIRHDISEHAQWAQIFSRMAQECLSSWEAEATGQA